MDTVIKLTYNSTTSEIFNNPHIEREINEDLNDWEVLIHLIPQIEDTNYNINVFSV